ARIGAIAARSLWATDRPRERAARARAAPHPAVGETELPHLRRVTRLLPRASREGSAVTVSLVGAGPGDPELITLRGLARVRACEVLVYDRPVASELGAEAPIRSLRLAREGRSPADIN